MAQRTVLVAVCVVVVAVVVVTGAHLPSYPSYAAPPSYSRASATHQTDYPTIPPKYTYDYGVTDHYSGANFGHTESREGYKTEGRYTVDLPDGRKQIVTYVDKGDGLEAEVIYEGEAKYPVYKPELSYKPAPVYKPVPVYKSPPVYKPLYSKPSVYYT